MKHIALSIAVLLLSVTPSYALDDPSEMLQNPAQEHRAEVIGAQLRCLVCQNESIEDSSAPLARDLRHVVRQQVAQGHSNQAVIAWMTERYGDFVRLKPRLTWATVWLWGIPCLALICGLWLAYRATRRGAEPPPLSTSERDTFIAMLSRTQPRDRTQKGNDF